MKTRDVVSVDDLIDVLGGPSAAATLFGTTPQNVVNWRAVGRVPAKFFIAHRNILKRRRIRTPVSLWGMEEARAEPAEASPAQ